MDMFVTGACSGITCQSGENPKSSLGGSADLSPTFYGGYEWRVCNVPADTTVVRLVTWATENNFKIMGLRASLFPGCCDVLLADAALISEVAK